MTNPDESGNDRQPTAVVVTEPAAPGIRPARLLADPIAQSVIFILAVSAFFLIFPRVDLWFSGLFYESGHGFPMGRLGALVGLRDIGTWLVRLAAGLLLASALVKLALPDRPSPIRPRVSLFLWSTLAIGPGLLVNVLLKNQWGRPRPAAIGFFHGDVPFVGVWQASDFCASNCSFVSGEASSALWLVACALIVPARWRPAAARVLLALAVLLSFNRIAAGAHFLSDVLLSWGLTALVLLVGYRFILERPPAWLTDDAMEAVAARIGHGLRRWVRPRPDRSDAGRSDARDSAPPPSGNNGG